MTHKLKRKYLVNNEEYYAVDNLQEFMSLFGKYYNASSVVRALHQVATKVKSAKDLQVVEEVITKHIIYNNNAGMYKENDKTFLAHKIMAYKMPKDLEKTILDVCKTLNTANNKNIEEKNILSSLNV